MISCFPIPITDRSCFFFSYLINGTAIGYREGNILDTITTTGNFIHHFGVAFRLNGTFKDKSSIALANNVSGDITATSLKTTVGNVLETETSAVVGSSLLCVGNSETKMVESGVG